MVRALHVISDLHLGNDGPYDIFAGTTSLPRLLRGLAGADSEMVVNGDMMDFLLDADAMTLDERTAVERAEKILDNPRLGNVWAAWAAYLADGGVLSIRPGNHDVELILPAVQERVRRRFAPHGERVRFIPPTEPYVVEVGGVRVVLEHGEEADDWNRIDWATAASAPDRFRFPPGSRLVKALLNPAKLDHRIRFADLLKPDLAGGALAALAVKPSAIRVLLQGEVGGMVWQYLRRLNGDPLGSMGGPGADLGLRPRAELDDDDLLLLEEFLAGGDLPSGGLTDGLWARVLRAGLSGYCRAWRSMVGDAGAAFFDRTPEVEEWEAARTIASTRRAAIVVVGHTHAPRFGHFGGTTLINTGTWIPLMQLPAADAPLAVWERFLEQLQADPALAGDAAVWLKTSFTAAEIRAEDGGARACLLEVGEDGVDVLGEAFVPALR